MSNMIYTYCCTKCNKSVALKSIEKPPTCCGEKMEHKLPPCRAINNKFTPKINIEKFFNNKKSNK